MRRPARRPRMAAECPPPPQPWQSWLDARCALPEPSTLGLRVALGLEPMPDWAPLPPPAKETST
jgi:hypothetical protein